MRILLPILLALVSIGLVLGMIGIFNAWLVLVTGSIIGIRLSALWAPPVRTEADRPIVWRVAVVIAVASVVLNSAFPSERYIGGRDGGTYLATGALLERGSSLFIDARPGPYRDSSALEFAGPGFFDSDDGRLRPQFLHGLPVVLATGRGIGGDPLMLRINAVVGGLALLVVFAFARLLVGGWFALLLEVTLAVNLVFAYFARAPFSEILAITFIFGGLWALWNAWEAQSKRNAVLAGLLLGGSLLARLDSLVLLTPLVAYLAYAQRKAAGNSNGVALVRGVWRGLLPMIAIAFLDLVYVTPDYLANHRSQVVPILAVVALIVVGDGLAGGRIRNLVGQISPSTRSAIDWITGGTLLVVLAFAYFLRPLVQEVAGSPYLGLVMDPAELAAGSDRLFSENSARWLGWYLGPPAVFLGFAGWAWLTKRVLEGFRRLALPFLLLFSSMALLYLWRPSINPDHIWVMRRFLPLVIPGLLVMGVYLLRELWDVAASWDHRAGWRAGVGVLAAATMAGSLLVFAPQAGLHEFGELGSDLHDGCEMMGDDAAVLIVDTPGGAVGSRLAPTFRSHCALPTAYTADIDTMLITDLERSWKAEGRTLWLVGVDRRLLAELGLGEVQEILVGTYEILELTFTHRPSEAAEFGVAVYGVQTSGT